MPDMGVDPAVPGSEETEHIIWFPKSDMIFVDHHFTSDVNLFPGLTSDTEVKGDYYSVILLPGMWSRDDSKLW